MSVPCTSLFKTVTVRCGHCTNLLPVNLRGLLLPSANQLHLGHAFFSPSHNLLVYDNQREAGFSQIKILNFLYELSNICCCFVDKYMFIYMLQEEIPNPSPNFLINQTTANEFAVSARGGADELPRPPVINRREIHIYMIFSIYFLLLFQGYGYGCS